MNPTFFLGVYKDQDLAKKRIATLRRIFPKSVILSVSDGVDDAAYEAACRANRVFYTLGKRIKTQGFGGQWLERALLTFTRQGSGSHLIKIDPDTGVFRPALATPETDVFGSYTLGPYGLTDIASGVFGMTRVAALRILGSKLLQDPKYAAPEYSYARFAFPFIKRDEAFEPVQITMEGRILADVVKRLDLTISTWPSAISIPGPCTEISPGNNALAHPYYGA